MVVFRNSSVAMKMDSGYLNKMGIYWKDIRAHSSKKEGLA